MFWVRTQALLRGEVTGAIIHEDLVSRLDYLPNLHYLSVLLFYEVDVVLRVASMVDEPQASEQQLKLFWVP